MNAYEAPRTLLYAIRNAQSHLEDLTLLHDKMMNTVGGFAASRTLDAVVAARKTLEILRSTIDDLETPAGWDVAIFLNVNGEFDRVENGDLNAVHVKYCDHMLHCVLNPKNSHDWVIEFATTVREQGFNAKTFKEAQTKMAS